MLTHQNRVSDIFVYVSAVIDQIKEGHAKAQKPNMKLYSAYDIAGDTYYLFEGVLLVHLKTVLEFDGRGFPVTIAPNDSYRYPLVPKRQMPLGHSYPKGQGASRDFAFFRDGDVEVKVPITLAGLRKHEPSLLLKLLTDLKQVHSEKV